MKSLRNITLRLTNADTERKAKRALLKQAKFGNTKDYLSLTEEYINLPLVYFGSSLHESKEKRFERVEQIFTALWQQLHYAERLSDFEYMLTRAIIDNTPKCVNFKSTDPLVTKLRLLEPESRFAFISYEFEKWSSRWVALSMRVRPNLFHRLISQARCELCGVSWESLIDEECLRLEEVSHSMDRSPNLQDNKILSIRVSNLPRVNEIKALWLELRPQLVEIHYRYVPKGREQILDNISTAIQLEPMNRPPIMDKLINAIHFVRHAKINVS